MDKPVRTTESGFFVAGYQVRTHPGLEADPQQAKLPALWRQMESGALERLLPRRLARGKPFVVYFDYEEPPQGAYSVLLGYQVVGQADVPPGLGGLYVPAGRYLMFTALGPKPQAPAQAWREIRAYFAQPGAPPRAYTYDFEVHEDPGRTSLFVAI